MKKPMSDAASEILQGWQEALLDVRGVPVKGIKQRMVCRGAPKEIMTCSCRLCQRLRPDFVQSA